MKFQIYHIEDCCTVFTPASPKTKPKREKVIFYESFVDFEPLIDTAIANTETLTIEPKVALNQEMEDLF